MSSRFSGPYCKLVGSSELPPGGAHLYRSWHLCLRPSNIFLVISKSQCLARKLLVSVDLVIVHFIPFKF